MSTATKSVLDPSPSTGTARSRAFLRGFVFVQGKVCRMLLRGEVAVRLDTGKSVSKLGDSPAATDGDTIWINEGVVTTTLNKALKPSGKFDPEAIAVLNALVKHELSHVLFSPRLPRTGHTANNSHPLSSTLFGQRQQEWNMLEDQRIENMFLALYPIMKPHFNLLVAEYLLDPKNARYDYTTFFLLHGRRYLPASLVKGYRDKLHSHMVINRMYTIVEADKFVVDVERVIDAFLPLEYSQIANDDSRKGEALIEEYARLLKLVDPHQSTLNPTGGQLAPDNRNEAGGKSPSTPNESKVKEAQKEAKRLREQSATEKAEQKEAGDSTPGNEPAKGEEADGGEQGKGDVNGEGKPSHDGDDVNEADLRTGTTDEKSEAIESDEEAPGGGTGAGGGGKSLATQVQDLLDEAMNSQIVQDDADRTAKSVSNALTTGVLENIDDATPATWRSFTPVEPDMRRASEDIAMILRSLRNEMSPEWERGTRQGRFDMRRYIKDEAGSTPPINVFRKWNEGTEQDATMDIIIAVDMSGSMSSYVNATMKAAWTVKTALHKVGIPCGIVGFADGGVAWPQLLCPQKEAISGTQVPIPQLGGGTNTVPAQQAAMKHFAYTHAKNPVFLLLTDGAFNEPIKSEELTKQMNAAGILTVLLGLNVAVRKHGNQSFQIASDIGAPKDIPPIIRRLVAGLMRKALHR